MKEKKLLVFLTLCTNIVFANIVSNDLEIAFGQNFKASHSTNEIIDFSDLAIETADAGYFPQVSLQQSLQTQNFQTVGLQVTLKTDYNVFDPKRDVRKQLAELQKNFASLEKDQEKLDALFRLRQYVQLLNNFETALTIVQRLEVDVRKARPHWLPTTPSAKFAPNEIDMYLKFLELVDSKKGLENQSNKIRVQISKWTKIPLADLGQGKIEFPGDVRFPGVSDEAQCVAQSVNVQRAQLRLEQERLNDRLQSEAFPTVTVSGGVTVTTNPAAGQSPVSYQVGISANIPIGPTSPVAGGVQGAVSTTGASQSAVLSWPNPYRVSEPQGAVWAQKNLDDVKEAAQDELKELLRSRESLLNTVLVNKQRLDWGERSLRDAAGTDELVRLGARFALVGLKMRALYDHFSLQANALNVSQFCGMTVAYQPRDAVFAQTTPPGAEK